jgi:Clp amino terminal domain, pathogenicity island component
VPPDSVVSPSPELSLALAATDQSQRGMHAPVPGTQHLLLGLLAASQDIAAVFAAQGIALDMVEEEIRRGTG